MKTWAGNLAGSPGAGPPAPYRAAGRGLGRALVALALVMMSAAACWGQHSDLTRFYLGLRLGETNPVVSARDVKGFSPGVNLGRNFGGEISGDLYEFKFTAPGYGYIGDWAVFGLRDFLRGDARAEEARAPDGPA